MARPTKVTDWYYDVKDLEVLERDPSTDEEEEGAEPKKRFITKKVKVTVWMEKETTEEGEAPYALKSINFLVTCDEPKFKYSGTDIELLRLTAWGDLDKKYEVKWENYYLVKVQPERIYSGTGAGLSFSYDFVYKGTTWNGKELLKQTMWRGEPKISPWPGRFTDEGGRTIACIEATNANREALEEFSRRVDKLREMMRDTLKPEVIMQTLQNMAGLALLPQTTDDENSDTEDTGDRQTRRRRVRAG
jgi:hypothetical protein